MCVCVCVCIVPHGGAAVELTLIQHWMSEDEVEEKEEGGGAGEEGRGEAWVEVRAGGGARERSPSDFAKN